MFLQMTDIVRTKNQNAGPMGRNATQKESVQIDSSRNEVIAPFIAWFLLGASAAIFLLALALLLLVPSVARGPDTYGSDYIIGFILLFYSLLGALIAARHPGNPIGWIFIAMGLGSEAHILAVGYLIYGNFRSPNSIQFPLILFSLLVNPFILVRALGPLGLLIFPDGKFLSPRWRIVAWVPIALGLLWYIFFIPMPVAGLPADRFHSIIQSIIQSTSSKISVLITTASGSLIEAFFAVAAIGLILRLHQAKGEQREQLKWFVYATILAVSITSGLTILDALSNLQASQAFIGIAASRWIDILPEIAFVSIPLAAFLAIYKYHLYDIDLIINRTLVYIPLTAILAGLYAASVTLFQRLFLASTGQKSDAAFVISSLILAATFTPIKNSLQNKVDKLFKEPPDPLKELRAFGKQVDSVTGILNPRRATRQLLDVSMAAFHVTSGAIYLAHEGEMVLEHASTDWKKGNGVVNLPLAQNGIQLGLLVLGLRKDNKEYSFEDRQLLQREVDRVAEMIWLTQLLVDMQSTRE